MLHYLEYDARYISCNDTRMIKPRSKTHLGKLRESAGYDQKTVAGMLNIDISYLGRIETKKIGLTPDRAKVLADLYKVDLDVIYGRSKAPEPQTPAPGVDREVLLYQALYISDKVRKERKLTLDIEQQARIMNMLIAEAETEAREGNKPVIALSAARRIFDEALSPIGALPPHKAGKSA